MFLLTVLLFLIWTHSLPARCRVHVPIWFMTHWINNLVDFTDFFFHNIKWCTFLSTHQQHSHARCGRAKIPLEFMYTAPAKIVKLRNKLCLYGNYLIAAIVFSCSEWPLFFFCFCVDFFGRDVFFIFSVFILWAYYFCHSRIYRK